MAISIVSFKQASRKLNITRSKLIETLKQFDLIKTEGYERVYHDKKTGRHTFSTERFSGEYIVNNQSVCFKSESGGKIPQQFLDSRVVDVLRIRMTTHS
jgi:hypothetical protein